MRIPMAIAAIILCAIAAPAQTVEQVEKRLTQLPPEQRAYERYRYWLTMQPPEAQRSPDRMEKYRAWLNVRGFAEPDIDAQIAIVNSQASKLEVERWNQILTAEKPAFNTQPNAFLVEMMKGRKPGTAVDVGMGQGRNAIWLAQQGWAVTGFDPADKAVALAKQTAQNLGVRLTTEITTTEQFDFGESRWDLIVLSYVGGRGLTERLERALKPHGILLLEGFHRDATKGRSIGGGVVFDTGEVIGLFPHLRVVRYEEPVTKADFGPEVRVVRYCAEKAE
jgi:SAM-dependent methyltransferase